MSRKRNNASERRGSAKKIPIGPATYLAKWNANHPVLSIVLVSLIAVIVNCYPIIFFGKSFVSPSCVKAEVYDWWPPMPGMTEDKLWDRHGSDTGAIMWDSVPCAMIESRCLLEHGELPLWNRFGRAGDTLIGQVGSMFGEPLHLIVMLGGGSALSWDLKYLIDKFLFCVGFGLLIRRLLNSNPLSLLYAALAAYSGVYFYLVNHPSFFVFTYSPWILLASIEMLDIKTAHTIRWGFVWLLANFSCFNAGQVETALTLILGLNLAALANSLLNYPSAQAIKLIVSRLTIGTLLFLGLTAPWWISFLGAVHDAYSTHLSIKVTQLPLIFLPGLFDDVFYLMAKEQLGSTEGDAIAPCTSMLIWVGCLFAILRWRQLKHVTFFWVNTVAIVLWSGCIFGWIPGSFLILIPFLNQIGHTDQQFSFLLIIHLTLQSAYGFKCLADAPAYSKAIHDFIWIVIVTLASIFIYLFFIYYTDIQWIYLFTVFISAIIAPLLFVLFKNTIIQDEKRVILAWFIVILVGFIPQYRFAFYNFGDPLLLMIPGNRSDLTAPSLAIDKIKNDKTGPFRVTGVREILIGDTSAIYNLEDIRSSTPVANKDFISLASGIPGITFIPGDWRIRLDDPSTAQPLLNLLNVKYILAPPSTTMLGKVNFKVFDKSDFLVLTNPDAWPRAFFSNQIVPISSTEYFIQYLKAHSKTPFIAIDDDEIAEYPFLQNEQLKAENVITAATNYQLLPNSTSFDIHASSDGVVCLTEGQAHDFYAIVNHEYREVLTVNRAFKGVYLEKAGDYHIEFIYRPHYWIFACTLFWISITGIATLLIFRQKINVVVGAMNNL